MELQFRAAEASENDAIRSLLFHLKLPMDSLGSTTTKFTVAAEGGTIVGIAGFEYYGTDALLRSVAVAPSMQNKGVGGSLVDFMIAAARELGIKRIVLLTETAERFFSRKGFTTVDRASITNEALIQSSEFAYACPASAVCMVLKI